MLCNKINSWSLIQHMCVNKALREYLVYFKLNNHIRFNIDFNWDFILNMNGVSQTAIPRFPRGQHNINIAVI